MKRLRASTIFGAVLALVLCAIPNPARARTSFDFLFSMDNVSNDNQFFLNVAVDNYGYSRRDLEPVLPRLRYVEADLPVVLFLAHECGRPPAYIVDMRSRGMSWGVIFDRVGVRYDVLFRGIDRDPGPPYGNAWGHWKRNRRGYRMNDSDIVGLVQLQVGARACRVRPYEMARYRGQGRSVAYVVADKHGRPYRHGKHGRDRGHDRDWDRDGDRDRDRDGDRDRDRDHGRPHHHGPDDHD